MSAKFEGQPVDLAKEDDFRLGAIQIRPSIRQVDRDGNSETLEPRIMQVLVALARNRGEVVSRDELIQTCWEGRVVGDDALNRCTSKIRKLGEAKGDFRLETIPRVGYRLHDNSAPAQTNTPPSGAVSKSPRTLSRRTVTLVVAGLIAFAVALAGWQMLGRSDKTIAVLPFANDTGDPNKDYIARGVAVEIIDRLSQLEGVKVISRNSSFTFGPDADARKVGKDLKVA